MNPLVINNASISQRSDNLRALAENTDGLAVVDTNDIDKGMKRIVDDLTSYYLLGYTSTNGKLDGRYRKISVRVKRPGVDVRARRGYRAATEKEVEEGRMAQVKQIDVWALVELDSAVLRQSDWMAGGSVDATLLGADGAAVASQSTDLPAGEHAVAIDMGEVDAPDGEVTVRTRITPKSDQHVRATTRARR